METIHIYRHYESKQINILDAFESETYDPETKQLQKQSMYVQYDPTEWYWDKRLWTVELVNLMFDMEEDEAQCFGIDKGDEIREYLEITPEISHQIISHKINDDGEKEQVIFESMTLYNLIKGKTDGHIIGCNIHKNWKKYGLYELILRRCSYNAIQNTVIAIHNAIQE